MLVIISRLKERLRVLKSLKLVIFLLLVLVAMVPLSVYSVISTKLYLSGAISQRIAELQSHATIISNLVVNSNFFASDDITELNTEINQVAEVYKGRILIIDKDLTIVKDTYNSFYGKVVECNLSCRSNIHEFFD